MKFVLFPAVLLFLLACGEGIKNDSIDDEDELNPLTQREQITEIIEEEYPGIDMNDVCVDSCYDLKDLFIVGFFAHDRGCGGARYFFKGKEIDFDDASMKAVMDHNNYKTNRFSVAQAYHTEVANHYQHDLSTKPDRFDEGGYEFFEPTSVREGDKIISTIWIQERGGMLPEVGFHISKLVFDLDGFVLEHTRDNHFTIKF